MDEIAKASQDSLPTTGRTSDSVGESTSQGTRTYTEDELRKAVNDALAKAGRDAKALASERARITAEREAFEAAKKEWAEKEKELEEAELEKAKADPDAFRKYQAKIAEERKRLKERERQLIEKEAALERSRAEHEAELQAMRDLQREIKINEIAAKTGVDASFLKELGLENVEQIELVAQKLNNLIAKVKGETAKISPDSGITSGSLGVFSPEQFERLPIEEKAKYLYKKK